MNGLKLLAISVMCLLIENLFFKLADRYNIVDKPNHRTLHEHHTIRGGGIVFPLSVFLYFVFFGVGSWPFATGLLIIAMVSFVDDLGHVNTFLRFACHMIAISSISWGIGYLAWGWWVLILVILISTGVLNAYNFMDGINGITGGYSTVTVITLIVVNNFFIRFESNFLLLTVLISLMIFNYYNFRNKARCFAGDVGSISISFILVYFILKLIFLTKNPIFILLFAVYGVDSVLTILLRLYRKENIFKAHRSHLFQVIVFNGKLPHLRMASIYLIVQLIVNSIILQVMSLPNPCQIFLSLLILLILSITYFFLKNRYANMI